MELSEISIKLQQKGFTVENPETSGKTKIYRFKKPGENAIEILQVPKSPEVISVKRQDGKTKACKNFSEVWEFLKELF